MKKVIVAICISFFLISLSFSFDFGLNIGNTTEFLKQYEEQQFLQSNSASLWLNQKSKNYEAAVSASYIFSYINATDYTLIDKGVFDLDYLYYLGFFNFDGSAIHSLDLQVGRFFAQDISSYVFSSKLDGIRLELAAKNMSFGAQAYYTGLLLTKTNSIRMSYVDIDNAFDEEKLFGSKRAVYSVSAFFDDFAFRQSANIEFIGQNDFNDREEDFIDSYYVNLGFNGPIIPALRYNIQSIYEFAQLPENNEQYVLIDGSILFVAPSIKADFSLGGIFSFALQEESSGFSAITEKPLSFVSASISPKNVQTIQVMSNFHFTSYMSLSLSGQVFLKQSDENIFVPYADDESEGSYLGTEIGMAFKFSPSSDFDLGLTAGILLLNEKIIEEDFIVNPFKISLSASIFI